MAGQEIYLGKMIESLQGDIATVVSTLNQHSIELGNINNTVAQGVNVLNAKAGNSKVINFTHGEINLNGVDASWNYEEKAGILLRCLANGVITVSCELKAKGTYSGSTKIGLGVDISNVYPGPYIGASNNNYIPVTFNVAVTAGTIIKLFAWTAIGVDFYMKANSFQISYDLLDIVNDGAFVSVN